MTKDSWELQKLENAINEYADHRVYKYFWNDYIDERYWIWEDVWWVLCIDDRSFNLDHMMDYERHWYTYGEMMEHYYYCIDCYYDKKSPINIKNYKHMKANNMLSQNTDSEVTK